MEVPKALLELLKQFENHPLLGDFVMRPENWDPVNGDVPFAENFVYFDLEGAKTPSADLLALALDLDTALQKFVFPDNSCLPFQHAVDQLREHGREVFGVVTSDKLWLSTAIRLRQGPYIFD